MTTRGFRRLIVLLLFVCLALPASANATPLTLHDAIDRALKFAPSVSMASADRDLSSARAREQRAPLLPSISAGAEYYQAPGYNEVITNRGLSAGLLTLNYTAWDWGRRQATWRAARYVSEAAALGIAAARAQIVFDTTIAYYDLMHQRATERELDSNLDRISRYVVTIESLQSSGRAITNDVLKIRSAQNVAELSLSSVHNTMLRAQVNLGTLMGQADSRDLETVDTSDISPLPAGDVNQTPAMQAASRAISSATQQLKAAKAERLPTFQVALTTGALGVDPPATVNHNYGASYDGVISMPVFEGGAIFARIDQAKAKLNAADAQYRQTQYLIERRLKDAAVRYQQAREALAITARSQPTADDAFALAWTRFLGGGNVTLLEVLDSYQQAEQLRIDRLNHEFDAREAATETALLYGQTL